jgi:hypothetical protein
MTIKKTFITVLFPFFFVAPLTAQSSHTIKGTVTDENDAPLPFVNIFFITSKTGTITNNEGAFSLRFSGNTEILIGSFIGYETQTIEIDRNTEFVKIQMKPSAVQLGEFTVTAFSAADLLKKAIEKIPENYPQQPVLFRAYVRHKVSEADTLRYMQEMAYNIVRSYRSSALDEIFLVRNRNFRFAHDYGGLKGIGDIDIVKYASENFSTRFFRNATIRYLPSTTFDDRPTYVLEIFRKNKENNSIGKIYIDMEDLAIVRFDMGREGGNRSLAQYRKIEDKYYLMFGNTTTINKWDNRIFPAKSDFLVTEIIHSFSREDIEGTPIKAMDVLEVYATQKDDTIFWQKYNTILPDSTILKALERYSTTRRKRSVHENSLEYQAYMRRLYLPNISLKFSSDLANDFSMFNYNSYSINRYVPHLLDRNLHKPVAKFFSIMAYSYLISPILGEVASEWLLMNKNGIQTKVNPNPFNRYRVPYLYNANNDVLSDFKNNNYFDFMRLHSISRDGRHVKSFLIEEDLAKTDLSNKNNRYSYITLFCLELLAYRAMNLDNLARRDIVPSNKPENRLPLIIDSRKSWVNYLFNPEMEFQRHIQKSDLTDEEQKYFKRSGYWSLLNFVSPQMFLIPKFSFGEKHSFTFNAYYLPIPFGEMFGQNIWFMQNYSQLHGVFFKQYRNYEKTTFGIGYKLYDVSLFRNMYMTSSIDYWQQPTDFDFRSTSSFGGFRVGQTFEYKLLQSPFSDQHKLSLMLVYDYKTKGYMPESFFMEENFNANIGFKWNF